MNAYDQLRRHYRDLPELPGADEAADWTPADPQAIKAGICRRNVWGYVPIQVRARLGKLLAEIAAAAAAERPADLSVMTFDERWASYPASMSFEDRLRRDIETYEALTGPENVRVVSTGGGGASDRLARRQRLDARAIPAARAVDRAVGPRPTAARRSFRPVGARRARPLAPREQAHHLGQHGRVRPGARPVARPLHALPDQPAMARGSRTGPVANHRHRLLRRPRRRLRQSHRVAARGSIRGAAAGRYRRAAARGNAARSRAGGSAGREPYAELVETVRDYLEATGRPEAYFDRWRRVLAGLGAEEHDNPMTADEAQSYHDRGWGPRWAPIAKALREIEAARG